MRLHVVAGIPWFVLSLAAQAAPAPEVPKRSLADGLVRQRIEIDALKPPVLTSGLEIGAGRGPMVLVVRQRDGALVMHEIQRGGDHGPAAEETDLGDMPAEEAVDEAPVGPRKAPPPLRVGVERGVELALDRKDGELALGSEAAPRALVGPTADKDRLRTFLAAQAETTRGTTFAGRFHLRVAPDIVLQDVLTTWAIAREVGFTTLLIEDRPPGKVLSNADREFLANLPKQCEWPVEMRHGVMPVCDAELLFLVEGTTPFGEVSGLIRACAKAGIWQLGFVGQQDARTRWKLPMHVPFDG